MILDLVNIGWSGWILLILQPILMFASKDRAYPTKAPLHLKTCSKSFITLGSDNDNMKFVKCFVHMSPKLCLKNDDSIHG
jgi:hypothetical protein